MDAVQPTIPTLADKSTLAKTIQATNFSALKTTTEKAHLATVENSQSSTVTST